MLTLNKRGTTRFVFFCFPLGSQSRSDGGRFFNDCRWQLFPRSSRKVERRYSSSFCTKMIGLSIQAISILLRGSPVLLLNKSLGLNKIFWLCFLYYECRSRITGTGSYSGEGLVLLVMWSKCLIWDQVRWRDFSCSHTLYVEPRDPHSLTSAS